MSSQNTHASQLLATEGDDAFTNDSRDDFKVMDNELAEISCFVKPFRSASAVLWVFTAIIILDCVEPRRDFSGQNEETKEV